MKFGPYEATDDKLVDTEHNHDVHRYRWVHEVRRFQEKASPEEFEKAKEWFLSVCRPVEYLNFRNAQADDAGGRIVSLVFHEDDDYDEPIEPTPEEYERLGLDPENLGCVEAHPEGADRGGYVLTLSNGCYYDEGGCEWQG